MISRTRAWRWIWKSHRFSKPLMPGVGHLSWRSRSRFLACSQVSWL